jgi:hypothetical protein
MSASKKWFLKHENLVLIASPLYLPGARHSSPIRSVMLVAMSLKASISIIEVKASAKKFELRPVGTTNPIL